MKKINTIICCLLITIGLSAQLPGGGGYIFNYPTTVKTYNIFPISDEEVEINGICGGTQDVVPYDFYATFNCSVEHTLDSVFYVDCDTTLLEVASPVPCYVIIYGINQGQEAGFHFIPVTSYSNGKYRVSTRIGDLCLYLNRIIVTSATQYLKKAVVDESGVLPPAPGLLGTNTNSVNVGRSVLPLTCTVTLTDTSDNTTQTITGSIASNMYFLYGTANSLVLGFSYYNAQLPHEPYSIFTTQSTTDVDMFVVNSDNEVIGHNNNYSVQSSHDWGMEARIDMSGNDSLKAVILVPYRSYIEHYDEYWGDGYFPWTDSTPEGTTNLYMGCKFYNIYTNNSNTYFPALRQNDALQSDPHRTLGIGIDYNCFAWAVGYYSYYFHKNYGGVSTVSGLMSYYAAEGYTSEGATEENSEIDIWENNGVCTHASIRSHTNGRSFGYAWESKDGFGGPRLMHPRYALTHDTQDPYDGYGHVAAYMIKDPYYVNRETIYENVNFSDEEIEELASAASSIDHRIVSDFESNYTLLEDDINKTHISNPFLFKFGIDSYKLMLDKCKTSSEYLQMMMLKLSKGSIIASYILLDIKDDSGNMKEELTLLKAPISQEKSESQSKRIVRSDLSEAVLFAKFLLDGDLTAKDLWKDVAYSDDDNVLSVNFENHRIDVDIFLTRDSNVSVIIGKYDGTSSKLIIDQQSLHPDVHHFSVNISEKGLYVVSLILDGHVYVKKVSVK